MDASYKSREFDKILDGLEYLIDEPNVSIRELMDNKFIGENTHFDTWENLLKAAGVTAEKDMEKQSFNEFISTHSCFDDWEEMLQQSASKYAYSRFEK